MQAPNLNKVPDAPQTPVALDFSAVKQRQQITWASGDYAVILRNGTELALSRNYRDRFSELFENHN